MVDLEARGLVERMPGSGAQRLRLTPAGGEHSARRGASEAEPNGTEDSSTRTRLNPNRPSPRSGPL